MTVFGVVCCMLSWHERIVHDVFTTGVHWGLNGFVCVYPCSVPLRSYWLGRFASLCVYVVCHQHAATRLLGLCVCASVPQEVLVVLVCASAQVAAGVHMLAASLCSSQGTVGAAFFQNGRFVMLQSPWVVCNCVWL